jgi:hypothetical protein
MTDKEKEKAGDDREKLMDTIHKVSPPPPTSSILRQFSFRSVLGSQRSRCRETGAEGAHRTRAFKTSIVVPYGDKEPMAFILRLAILPTPRCIVCSNPGHILREAFVAAFISPKMRINAIFHRIRSHQLRFFTFKSETVQLW